jgi:hypothetical protein
MTSTQAELLIADARRAAANIVRYGWRPDALEVRRLRLSTKHPPVYAVLCRAWRKAGFRLTAVRKLAGRAQ